MKTRVALLCVGVVCLAGLANASPVVLTFNDLPATYGALPAGYGGLTWTGDYGEGTGWASASYGPDCSVAGYLPHSPCIAVFTRIGTITFSTPTVFYGAWFSSQSTTSLTFSFYRDTAMTQFVSEFVKTIEHTNSISNEFVAGPNEAIGAIKISSGATIWIMDDFTYESTPANTPVPEPASMLLLGTGLVGAARTWRKRKA